MPNRSRGRGWWWLIGANAWMALASPATAATLAERCVIDKLKEAGKYDLCRLKSTAKAIQRGAPADYARCDSLFVSRWQRAEDRSSGQCPSIGDQPAARAFLAQHAADVASALADGGFPNCSADLAACAVNLSTCEADRASCEVTPHGQRIRTGSTTCTDNSGVTVACAGTGQDGELQRGLSRVYVDNGDGTISDTRSGLMWEKLSRDASIHGIQDGVGAVPFLSWTDAATIKVATLNAEAFGGHTDWRLPNINELQSLVDYGSVLPAIDPVFESNCVDMCTALTCSCTRSDFGAWYWSSTSYADPEFPQAAWFVDFDGGHLMVQDKSAALLVRAVRGGADPL